MRTVIHVGLHKCASTYLQERVFPKLDARYLRLGNHADAREFFLDEIRFGAPFDAPAFARRVERRAGADASADKPLVLSHEALSGDPHGQDAWDPIRIANRLRDAFRGASVFLVVRNQFDYALSMYAWRVCQAGLVSEGLSPFLRKMLKGGLDRKLQYDSLVASYGEIFGADRLLVLPVELLRHDQARFLETVRRFVGVEFRDTGVFEPARGENESTRSKRIISLLRAMNRPARAACAGLRLAGLRGPADKVEHRYVDFKRFRLLPWLRRAVRRSPLLQAPAWLHEEYGAAFAASNARLEKLTGLSLAQYGYALPDAARK